MANPAKMSRADTALLVIDVQEKLLPFIPGRDALIRNIGFLIDGARLLGVPVQATEQYPKGLGPTTPQLRERLGNIPEKVAFSCCAIPAVTESFRRDARTGIVLAGIETHVCVLQTALDLLADGFRVFVAADAVGSRYQVDHDYGLRRVEKAGAVLVTSEMALFEWTGAAGTPQFKEVSLLVQQRMKEMAQ